MSSFAFSWMYLILFSLTNGYDFVGTMWCFGECLPHRMTGLVKKQSHQLTLVRMTALEKGDLYAAGRNESYYFLEDNVEVSQKHRTTMWSISWPLGVHEGTGTSNPHILHRKKHIIHHYPNPKFKWPFCVLSKRHFCSALFLVSR